MSSVYLNILGLNSLPAQAELDQAYRRSCQRYQTLTARGPLRVYRNALLNDCEQAYRQLRAHLQGKQPLPNDEQMWEPTKPTTTSSKSVVAKHAAQQDVHLGQKPPIQSDVTRTVKLAGRPLSLRSRMVNRLRPDLHQPEKASAQMEDRFCKQVLIRLEGDLLRYDARQQLLHLADRWGIHRFRANFLIAQIVESVRQHHLYDNHLVSPGPKPHRKSRPKRALWRIILTAAAVGLFAAADYLLLRYFTS